jgi:hypothetical protein
MGVNGELEMTLKDAVVSSKVYYYFNIRADGMRENHEKHETVGLYSQSPSRNSNRGFAEHEQAGSNGNHWTVTIHFDRPTVENNHYS